MVIYGIEAWSPAPLVPPGPAANFMAVGGNNNQTEPLVSTSLDGETWTSKTAAASTYMADELPVLSAIATDGTRWVAVGYSNLTSNTVIYTSDDDGETWTFRTGDPTTNVQLWGICWTGSLWIAVGQTFSNDPVIMTSPDAQTWTARTSDPATAAKLYAVAYNSTLGIAVIAGVAETGVPRIQTSTNGTSWTQRTADSAGSAMTLKGTAANTSIAIVSGISGTNAIQSSPTGVTWTGRAGATPEFMAVTWNGTVFAAVGADAATELVPKVSTSTDGLTWTPQTSDPNTDPGNGLEWFGVCSGAAGELVAVGFEGDFSTPHIMFSSDDGATWIAKTPNPATNCNPFAVAAKP